ncbi:hypothetical protein VUR80DRAFT_3219 [Thermomyces stellatus]
MVNVSNPNTKSRLSQRTRAASIKKIQKKRASQPKDRAARADAKRGARPGLLPTSGPRAALSKKKAKKLEKRMAHALRRKMAEEGEVEMKDAEAAEEKEVEEGMEVEEEIA